MSDSIIARRGIISLSANRQAHAVIRSFILVNGAFANDPLVYISCAVHSTVSVGTDY